MPTLDRSDTDPARTRWVPGPLACGFAPNWCSALVTPRWDLLTTPQDPWWPWGIPHVPQLCCRASRVEAWSIVVRRPAGMSSMGPMDVSSGRGAGMDAELGEDVLKMPAHGAHRQPEPGGDLGIGLT